jgi:signal transduction histidine kinase
MRFDQVEMSHPGSISEQRAVDAAGENSFDGNRVSFRNDALADLWCWEWNRETNRISWSSGLCRSLGIDDSSISPSLEEFLRFVHTDDHEVVRNAIDSALSGNPFDRELRFLLGSGKLLRVYSLGIPICDRSGEIVSVVVICRKFETPVPPSDCSTSDLLLIQAEQVANFGTWTFDAKIGVATLSTRLARMLGLQPGTRLSERDYWSQIHPDDRPRVIDAVTAAISANRAFQFVARYLHPSQGVRHHFVRGIPIAAEDGTTKTLAGITLDFSEQTNAEGELHRLSRQLLRARDEERRNIARELHESTGQTLAALKMSLGRLREALPEEDERLHALLRSAVDLAEEAVREVRTLSYLMHPPLLDEAGLRSALRWYVKGFSERSGISVELDIPDDFGRYGQEIETTVFRIVQEALTNLHRYSGSRTATIRLACADGFVSALIRDEGCGLPVPSDCRDTSLGVGIVGMRERVKQLNGRFEMESSPGKGTAIHVTLPIVSEKLSPPPGVK